MHLQLDEERALLQYTVRGFAKDQVRPHARSWEEKGAIDAAALDQAWQLGFAALGAGPSFGGAAERDDAVPSALSGTLVLEELAWADLGFALAVCSPLHATVPLALFGVWMQRLLDTGDPRVILATYREYLFRVSLPTIAVFLVATYMWPHIKRILPVRVWLDSFILRLPIWGMLHKTRSLVQFSGSLEKLYSAGVAPGTAWSAASAACPNSVMANALRYSPSGSAVEVVLDTDGEREAVVSVTDHGVGIPREKQPRIFEPFYRAHTDTPYDFGGMGGGLYLAKAIVTRHGGTIGFVSEEGRGSTFTFRLPLGGADRLRPAPGTREVGAGEGGTGEASVRTNRTAASKLAGVGSSAITFQPAGVWVRVGGRRRRGGPPRRRPLRHSLKRTMEVVMSECVRCAKAALVAAACLSAAACAPDLRPGEPPGPSGDPCATALICEDFEDLEPQTEPDEAIYAETNGGEVVVETTRSWSGKNSVKLSTDADDDYKAAMLVYGEPGVQLSPGNIYYGRMMFWLESVPADVSWTMIAGAGLVPGESYHANYRYGGHGSQLQATYETPDSYDTPPIGPSTSCWDDSAVPVAIARWTCAEWKFDGENDETQLWLDGVEVSDVHVRGAGEGCASQPPNYEWTAPTFTQLYVGWESYNLDEARTIWIDDLAFGTQRIGCPASP